MDLTFIPYKKIGNLEFKANRDYAFEIFGSPISQSKYGYPEKNKYLDDYGFFHILSSEKLEFEAIELFPDMTDEEIHLLCDSINIIISPDVSKTMEEIKKITDDMVLDADGEGYTSKKLGLRIYCPDNIVEEAIIHAIDYYNV